MKVGVLALNFGVYFHIKLAAENSLREDLIKVTPKAIALWGILVLDRLLLLLMAFSLLKSASNNDEA